MIDRQEIINSHPARYGTRDYNSGYNEGINDATEVINPTPLVERALKAANDNLKTANRYRALGYAAGCILIERGKGNQPMEQ
jgi:hypothetical protein